MMDLSMYAKYSPPTKPSYTHSSDKRVVTSLNIVQPPNTATLPIEMMIVMEEALEVGVPVQVQFEIIPTTETGMTGQSSSFWSTEFPDAPGAYIYLCNIKSVKSRIKPGSLEFVGKEEANLDHVINGTEDAIQEEKNKARMVQAKQKENDANRFTGLEI